MVWPRCRKWLYYHGGCYSSLHDFPFDLYHLIQWRSKNGRSTKELDQLEHLSAKIQELISNVVRIFLFLLIFSKTKSRFRTKTLKSSATSCLVSNYYIQIMFLCCVIDEISFFLSKDEFFRVDNWSTRLDTTNNALWVVETRLCI